MMMSGSDRTERIRTLHSNDKSLTIELMNLEYLNLHKKFKCFKLITFQINFANYDKLSK